MSATETRDGTHGGYGPAAGRGINGNGRNDADRGGRTIDLAVPPPSSESRGADADTITVVKRSGTLVPFRRDRILRAVESAFRDVKNIPASEPIPRQFHDATRAVTDAVVADARASASGGDTLSVEGIQDLVEVKLMEAGHYDVARGYILYRDEHKQLRSDSPRLVKVTRRDGSVVKFNPMKIASAVERAIRASRGVTGPTPGPVIDAVNLLTGKVSARCHELSDGDAPVDLERIQDEVERQMMAEGYFDVAKDFILYRAERARRRRETAGTADVAAAASEEGRTAEASPEERPDAGRAFPVRAKDGTPFTVTEGELRARIRSACEGFESVVDAEEIFSDSVLNFYDDIKVDEVDSSNILAARAKIERDPAYSYVAARLLLDVIYRETFGVGRDAADLADRHRAYFRTYLERAIAAERVNPALRDFDLDRLASAMDLSRDDGFAYLGLQTVYDRYLIHERDARLETPQIFWMRVSMGLALGEGEQKNERAIEFYDVLSKFLFTSSTPTLFNAGTLHSQMSSCYLSTVKDDLHHIFKCITDDAMLSKWAGGLGNDWSNVRATGSWIKGTNGRSQGVIPFLKVANDTAVAVNQCFAPETVVSTALGPRPIRDVKKGDLVLGASGKYREVLERYVYNQTDEMVEVDVKHSVEPLRVTAGHPVYGVAGVPIEQSVSRTLSWIEKGKVTPCWIDAGDLRPGDYVAQVIPTEVVVVPDFTEEDARFYGIMLGDGHCTVSRNEWGVSGHPVRDDHMAFVRRYLSDRGIYFWETESGETYGQIRWAQSRGVVRDATTGRILGGSEPSLSFSRDDLYGEDGKKRIHPRLAHLPHKLALAIVRGLIESDGCVSRGKEIYFTNTSRDLVEGFRYQLLRLGVPTAGQFRTRPYSHYGRRSDGSSASFIGTVKAFDVRVPAVPELAKVIGCQPIVKRNWFTYCGKLYTRVKRVTRIDPVPFVFDLKVETDESYMTAACLAHNGGKRKGAMCAYLETWHLDVEDFLELRKNTGDERRRTHDMNTANWIPDLFMKRVLGNGTWTLFSPSDVPDLHDLYGRAFEERYEEYEKMTREGRITLFRTVDAVTLWRKMLSMLFETGHPWITFKDPSNVRSPQDHAGVVHSSNLCTEILLNTSPDETAVCNLGSINLAAHTTPDGIDRALLESTVRTAVRMLDDVIDLNFYPTPEARNANLLHRPIGLGLMGFQDALYVRGIPYASAEAVEFADESMELISYYAILASSGLAAERGKYESYEGSKWSRGLLPIDTIGTLAEERGGDLLEVDRSSRLDWTPVRESVARHGMRNSNTMAIAPTATISNITGVTQSIEPAYKHLYAKSNLSGEFLVHNPYLVDDLKKRGLWDHDMIDDLKYFDGSILEIERVPDDLKRVYLTAFEIEPEWLIECASRRQKWIDMGQSLNLYIAEPSGKKLHDMYTFAWRRGLKTTYYLRSLGATQIEKSTTDINRRGVQPRWMKNKSASSNVRVSREEAAPVASASDDTGGLVPVCGLDGECESCQ